MSHFATIAIIRDGYRRRMSMSALPVPPGYPGGAAAAAGAALRVPNERRGTVMVPNRPAPGYETSSFEVAG